MDVLRSLNNKNLLKGQFDLMKSAAANRKATQEAYDKILQAKQIFLPEDDASFLKNPADGEDIWSKLFPKYEAPEKPTLPPSSIRLPSTCLEKVKLLGFQELLYGEIFGWEHRQLGWRATTILTHDGKSSVNLDGFPVGDETLDYIGFIRCGGDSTDLTDDEKVKLRSIASEDKPAVGIVVSYPASQLI
jgi:hypothetical protein